MHKSASLRRFHVRLDGRGQTRPAVEFANKYAHCTPIPYLPRPSPAGEKTHSNHADTLTPFWNTNEPYPSGLPVNAIQRTPGTLLGSAETSMSMHKKCGNSLTQHTMCSTTTVHGGRRGNGHFLVCHSFKFFSFFEDSTIASGTLPSSLTLRTNTSGPRYANYHGAMRLMQVNRYRCRLEARVHAHEVSSTWIVCTRLSYYCNNLA